MDESIDIRFLLNSPEVEQDAARVQSSVSGIEKTVESMAQAISNAFSEEILNTDEIESKVKAQKAVLKDLERSYEALRKKVDKMAPGQAKVVALDELAAAKQEIEGEKVALEQLVQVQEQYKEQNKNITTLIRLKKEELLKLTEGSEEYARVLMELGDLERRNDDVNRQGRIYRNDERAYKATTEAVQGLTGSMSAAVGVASLLGASEENLTKIQTRLQAVMAISIGVNQAAQVLNKDSYFSHLILVRAKNLLTVAETKLTAALWGSNLAAKALMTTLTLGGSAVIIGIITLVSKLRSEQEKQRKKQEEALASQKKYFESVGDGVSESLAEYRKLQALWRSLNGDSQKQQKFLKTHADKFKDLGVKITSARDAENLLIANEAKFIQSLMSKAQAAASMELAAEKYKSAVEKMVELENGVYSEDDMKQARRNVDRRESGASITQRAARQQQYGDDWLSVMYQQEAQAIARARLNEIIQKAQQEADKIVQVAVRNERIGEQLWGEAGIKPYDDGKEDYARSEAFKRYKVAILESMRELEKSRVAALREGKERELWELGIAHRATLDQIKKDQQELAEVYQAAGRGGLTQADKDGFAEREMNAYRVYVREHQELDEKYRKQLEEVYHSLGDVFLTEEERKRVEIERTYKTFREQAKKMFEGGNITADQYADIQIRIDKAEVYEGVKDLLPEFRDFQEQRLQLAKEYNDKISALQAANASGKYDAAIRQAKKQRDQALSDFDTAIEGSTTLWSKLFDQFAHFTNRELQSIVANAREVLAYVSSTPAADIQAKFGLSVEQLRNLKGNAEQLNAVYDAMGDKLQQMHSRNPFAEMVATVRQIRDNVKRLSDARSELVEAEASGDQSFIRDAQKKVEVLQRQESLLKGDLKEAATSAVSYLGELGNSFQAIGDAAGDAGLASFGKLLSEVSGIVEKALSGDLIGAGIAAVTTGLTALFSSRAKYKAALKQMQQDLESFAHEYKLIQADLQLDGEQSINIFSEDAFERAITALGQMQDFYEQFLAKVQERQEPRGVQTLIARMQEARGLVYDLGTKLENIKIVTRHKTLFRKEKSATLKELYPELFEGLEGFNVDAARALLSTNNQLNEEAKRQIQEVVDLYDQWAEAEEAFKDYLSTTFGEVGNSLADSIVSAFEEGTDAMENWSKSFNNVLKNLGKQLMQTLFFQKHFDQLEEDLTDLYSQFGDDPNRIASEVQDLFSNFFSGMSDTVDLAEQWYREFAEMAKQNGFDVSADSNSAKTGVSGQLHAQMTEGTASQLVGLWNYTALEIRQVRDLTTGQLSVLGTIRDEVGNLLVQVILIERNTRETAENTAETVGELKEGFRKLAEKLASIDRNTRSNSSRL